MVAVSRGSTSGGDSSGQVPRDVAWACAKRGSKSAIAELHEQLWISVSLGQVKSARAVLLDGGDVHHVYREDDPEPFVYKGRTIQCQLIHMAAFSQEEEMLKLLLEHGADVNAEAVAGALQLTRRRRVFAIHMAAAAGRVENIKLLVEHGAKPDQHAFVEGLEKDKFQYHYQPVHDAAWFNRRSSVRCLHDLKADVYTWNFQNERAIHIASRLGHVELVHDLLHDYCRDPVEVLSMKTKENLSPLDVAAQGGNFPPRFLHLFTTGLDHKKRAQVFFKVAKACPSATSALLRSNAETTAALLRSSPQKHDSSREVEVLDAAPIDRKWRASLQVGADEELIRADTLALLIRHAPSAAADLVDALVDAPTEENHEFHPVPIRACLPVGCGPWPISSAYQLEKVWSWSDNQPGRTARGHWPWQDELAWTDPKRGREVRVRVLRLQGVINDDVIHALSLCRDQRVFTRTAIHALLNFVWSQFHWLYEVDFVHAVLSAGVISFWILWSRSPPSLFLRCGLWSLVASQGMVQWMSFGLRLWTCSSSFGTAAALRRFVECQDLAYLVYGSATLLLAAVCFEDQWPSQELVSRVLLAVNSVLHWGNLLFRLRGFRWAGQRLLPITKSVHATSGMLIMMVTFLFGFLHSFWAMEPSEASDVIFYNVAMLLMTGEAFLDVESMSQANRLLMVTLSLIAVFLFLAVAMNIFIAVLGECYNSEQERMVTSFQLERAKICSTLLLGPKIQVRIGLLQGLSVVAAAVAAGTLWVLWCLFASAELPWQSLGAAGTLAVSILLLQSILRGTLTPGWSDRYLWLCCESSLEDHARWLTTQEDLEMVDAQARSTRLRRFIADSAIQTQSQTTATRERLDAVESSMKHELAKVHSRQELLEQVCGEIQADVKKLVHLVAALAPPQRAARESVPMDVATAAGTLPEDSARALGNTGRAQTTSVARTKHPSAGGFPQVAGGVPRVASDGDLRHITAEIANPVEQVKSKDSAPAAASRAGNGISELPGALSEVATTSENGGAFPGNCEPELEGATLGRVGGASSDTLQTVWIQGCPGLNGRFIPMRPHAGRASWVCVPYFLFHSGSCRWIIGKVLGDSTSCYAFVDDGGSSRSPSECSGPWFRCDAAGYWEEAPLLKCVTKR